LCVLFYRKKSKDFLILLIALYGLTAFLFLFYDNPPVKFRKLYAFSYTFLEYTFFAGAIWLNLNSKKARAIIVALSLSFLLFQCFYYFLTPQIRRLDSIPVGIETILLFVFIFFFFYENFKNTKSTYIYNHPGFWIAVGILIYLGGAFFLYILANHMEQSEIDKYWDFTYVAEILKNLLFITAVLLYRFKSKNETSLGQKSNLPFLDMN
jgi:hypothetical protein